MIERMFCRRLRMEKRTKRWGESGQKQREMETRHNTKTTQQNRNPKTKERKEKTAPTLSRHLAARAVSCVEHTLSSQDGFLARSREGRLSDSISFTRGCYQQVP